ncbi:hypothetical protein B0T16DRAFT_123230 [Cercophora newfieldiana]|uniref:Zn(2)-C6 fungal-type domain-containing protein n=1 Tax=Cercophora newfieldiana TaxID=92897 RepID=A0AA40CRP2_9PEZI|nr:hypothetical protein B0T16DRAFT_123230 [Cercophora newfieldiana]
MSSELPPLQPGRKRRAHKRSRNGCSTCKQRHIRCDEVKPICTNCLTRGGDCGYPELGGAGTVGSSSRSTGFGRGVSVGAELFGKQLVAVPSSPADPFDCLPIKMPHRSLELFHHYTHYRIFSRTAVPKNPDSECVGIALSNPGTFRACLLMTALNYSWISGPNTLKATDMEETYLYHKLEAMRLVNEQIADPIESTSDGCLSLIVSLAFVEAGMGDYAAAEAHLNGLFTLLDMKRPEEWQNRFYGVLQRVILATGSYIAAGKSLDGGNQQQLLSEEPDLGFHDEVPHHTKPPSPLFSTAPMIATRLSPFYLGASPCVEACKADIEGLVLINALRRLSSLPIIDPPTSPNSSRSSSVQPDDLSRPPSPPTLTDCRPNYTLPPDTTAALFADTDSYITSLLFKPHPIYRDIRPKSTVQLQESPRRSPSRSKSPTINTTLNYSLPFRPQPVPEDESPVSPSQAIRTLRTDPYATLPAELFPSPSRAWATAAYLFLHVMLLPGFRDHPLNTQPRKRKRDEPTVDPHLLRLLLDTLCADIQHTEEAMRLGKYSHELWLWKVLIGAYVVEVAGVGASGGRFMRSNEVRRERGKARHQGTDVEGVSNFYGWVIEGETHRRMRSASIEMDSGGEIAPGCGDSEEMDAETYVGEESRGVEAGGKYTTAAMGAWFDERLRSWSAATSIADWAGARQMLTRIVWPTQDNGVFRGEAVVEGLWQRALVSSGLDAMGTELPLMFAVDPRLM